ncbi:MAG: adenylosuccinate synthetase [Candidatus Woesearchaeota archaeon]
MDESLIQVDFQSMNGLEYIVQSTPLPSPSRYQVITDKKGHQLYFDHNERGKVNVYVVMGGQKGDEAKAKTTDLIMRTDPSVGWVYAPNSTHNAGKGVHTINKEGRDVRISLHLCPKTLTDPHIKNYIGPNTQINPFSLESEVFTFTAATGRNQLGIEYHLMIDAKANLVIPTNRADDIVGKPNAMGSTISGATSSAMYAAGKKAPLVEDVLYDPEEFLNAVKHQIELFNDSLKHDQELVEMGILSMKDLGLSLRDGPSLAKNSRLQALRNKLSDKEIDFFIHDNPETFLLEQYQRVMSRGLFYIGDTREEINHLIDQGQAGIIECVQSTLLSGGTKYSKNRTGAHTDGMGSIGDAGLTHPAIRYRPISVFKLGNTSVGGNGKTMSGFIRQDQLSRLSAISSKSKLPITFERTATLEEFLLPEQIHAAFTEVNQAFYQALEGGYSLHDSKVRIQGIDANFSLAEANALLAAYVFGETGETSKRSRIWRLDDMVETGVVYKTEGNAMQVRNALDRALSVKKIGVITAYKVVRPYRDYQVGTLINSGDPLLREELTVKACIPIIQILPSSPYLFTDGTNEVKKGKELHPHLCQYLDLVSSGREVIAIGHGRHTNDVAYVQKWKD